MKRVIALLLPLLFAGCAEQGPTGPSLEAGDFSFAANAQDVNSDNELRFTTIDVPGARSTSASGINAGGDVVGEYVDGTGRIRAYLLRNGAFTTIDFPGAVLTQARGIAPGGEIVGTYRLASDVIPGDPAPKLRGFLRTRQGEFLPVMFPGHKSTIAQRILPDGTILGCRHDNDTMESMRGVVIDRSGHNEIGVFSSMHNGATPDRRRIAGLYINMMEGPPGVGRAEGYVIDDGVFTPLLVPGSTFTQAWDVNPDGDVVGVYRNSTGFHGFVLGKDGYVSVDVPGAVDTRAVGINARGDVVGRFVAGGKTYGFVARRSR